MKLANYGLGTGFHLHDNYFLMKHDRTWRNKSCWGNSLYEGDGNGYLFVKENQHCFSLIFNYEFS